MKRATMVKMATIVALVALVSPGLFAQSPFDGTWVLNQRRSNFTGTTMKIEDAGNGAIRFINPNFTYTVKTDGTRVQTPDGGTMAFQRTGNDGYHETDWIKGKETGQANWALSDGGKTLTVHDYGTNPDGRKFSGTTTYARTGAGDGLAGEWKTTSTKMTPGSFTMKLVGHELTWEIPRIKATVMAPTNGKEAHPTGPTVPESLTLSITRQGVRSLKVVEELQGKTIFSGIYTVSPDGKTMTVEGKNARGEATKSVWEKQG
jgi:hypothetical protein